MNCRELRDELRRAGTGDLGAAAARHVASCPACAVRARAALLLRLGSERDEGAAPRAGFEERFRARLASDPAPAARSAWNGGFELLVRPALALAAMLTLLCAGLYVQASPDRGDDLVLLVESDPVFTTLFAGDPGTVFGESQDAPAATEVP
jgi:hypothetical protein